MKCIICKCEKIIKGMTTVVFDKNSNTIIFKNVPALICENCGEEFVCDEVSEKLLFQLEEEYHKNIEVEIINFAA